MMLKKYVAMTAVMTAIATPAFAQGMMGGDFRMDAMQANAFEIQSSQIALSKSRNPQVVRFAREAVRDHRAANVALAGGERNYVAARNSGGVGGLIEAPFAIAGGAVGAATGAATGVVSGTLNGGPVGAVEGLGNGASRGAAVGSRAFDGDVDTTAGTTVIPPNPQQQAMLAELSETPAGPRFDRLYGAMQVKSHEMAIGMYQSYATSGPNPALRAHAEQALPVLQQHYQMAQRLPGAR
jgi:predicted outer membrane protein